MGYSSSFLTTYKISQIDHKVLPFNKIISLMNSAGVTQTILSAQGTSKSENNYFIHKNIIAIIRIYDNAIVVVIDKSSHIC